MCFRALLYAVFHSIRIGFEGSKLKIVDQKASDGRVSQIGFPFLRWLPFRCGGCPVARSAPSPLHLPLILDRAEGFSGYENGVVEGSPVGVE